MLRERWLWLFLLVYLLMFNSTVEVLQRLRHPNIVWYYTSAEIKAAATLGDNPHKALVIVTEYCPGGDLRTLIRAKRGDETEPYERLPETQILLWDT